jgi:hypothetical protein
MSALPFNTKELASTPSVELRLADTGRSDGAATVGPRVLPQSTRHVSLSENGQTFRDDDCGCMANTGVDDITIGVVSWGEVLIESRGGWTKAMRSMLGAVEKATKRHMNGGLLSCSSCANHHILLP